MPIEPLQLNRNLLEARLKEGVSWRKIAKELNTSVGSVGRYIKLYGLSTRKDLQHKQHSPVDVEKLKEMTAQGLTAKEIAEQTGWDVNAIYWRHRTHDVRPPKVEVRLTSRQKQIIYGCLLGDGHITKKHHRMQMSQGQHQYEYLRWKTAQLQPYFSEIRQRDTFDKRINKREQGYYCYSVMSPVFQELRNLFYINKRKLITPEILDLLEPLALAVWYMDDGAHTETSGFTYLCTQCFSERENWLIAGWLFGKFDVKATVHHAAKGQFRIGMNRPASSKFFEVVQPYIIPEMMYKLGR